MQEVDEIYELQHNVSSLEVVLNEIALYHLLDCSMVIIEDEKIPMCLNPLAEAPIVTLDCVGAFLDELSRLCVWL